MTFIFVSVMMCFCSKVHFALITCASHFVSIFISRFENDEVDDEDKFKFDKDDE